MQSLNTVPSQGTFGQAVSVTNQNFSLLENAVNTVESTTIKNCGYFTTAAKLNSAYPNPQVGMYAVVGTTTKVIYRCNTSGTWTATSEDPTNNVVEDNLTSTSAENALSANQGRVLSNASPWDCFLPGSSSINVTFSGNSMTIAFTGRLCIFSKPIKSIITSAASGQTFTFSSNKLLVYNIDTDSFSQQSDGYVVKNNELFLLQWNISSHTYIGIMARLIDSLIKEDKLSQSYDCIVPSSSSISASISGDILNLSFSGNLVIVKQPTTKITTSAADGQTFSFTTNYMLVYDTTTDTFSLKSDGTTLLRTQLYMLQWNKYTHTYCGILARLVNSILKADKETVTYKQPFDCFLPKNGSITKSIDGDTLNLTFTGRLCIFSLPSVRIITSAADGQTFSFTTNYMLVYDVDADTFSLKSDGSTLSTKQLLLLQWNKTTHTYIGILARLLNSLDIAQIQSMPIAELNDRTREVGIKYQSQAFQTSAFSQFLEPTGQRIGQNMVMDMYLGFSQSAACYGDYAIICQDNYGSKFILVNMKTLTRVQDIPVTQKPYSEQHNNSASFSTQFYDESDPFPLLYLASIYDAKVYVMRITLDEDGVYSIAQVQEINLPTQDSSFGYFPDVWCDGSYLWVNTYAANSVTDSTGNAIKWFKFPLPTVDGSATTATIALSSSLDSWQTTFYAYKQDGFISNGKIYQGFGNSNEYPNYLAVYDLTNKTELDRITMPRNEQGYRQEPEGMFEYNGNIYVYRKRGNESDPRGIYILKLKN